MVVRLSRLSIIMFSYNHIDKSQFAECKKKKIFMRIIDIYGINIYFMILSILSYSLEIGYVKCITANIR